MIEKLGTGYQRIRSAIDDWGLPEPELRDTGTFFKITFRIAESIEAKLAEVNLDEDQEQIIRFVQENGKISTSEAGNLIGKTAETARKKLKQLVENAVFEPQAKSETDPTTVYVLKD